MVDVEKLRRLLSDAAPAPWKERDEELCDAHDKPLFIGESVGGQGGGVFSDAEDREVIIALRNTADKALTELEQLRARVASLETERDAVLEAALADEKHHQECRRQASEKSTELRLLLNALDSWAKSDKTMPANEFCQWLLRNRAEAVEEAKKALLSS